MKRLERFIAGSFIGLAAAFGAAGCATMPSPATRAVMTAGNVRIRQDVPLSERDIVALHQPNLFGVRAVNLNYVLRTGKIPMSDFGFYNDSIDWGRNDSFIRALRGIGQKACEKIGQSQALQDLLKKDHWTRGDRECWEENICCIAGQEMFAVPGLGKYRSHNELFGHPLNALSTDIDHDTQIREFDCKGMSFVRGCVIQRIEDSLLPAGGPPGAFKRAMNYFVIAGGVCFSDENKTGGHTFIFTPAGNIIESTEKPARGTGYKKSSAPLSFADFVAGKPLVTARGDVYGGYLTDKNAARAAAAPPRNYAP
jgi:hypothetical protein